MKPNFSQSYVLRETLRHMRKCPEISAKKTMQRLDEFKDQPELVKEALTTLSSLNKLTKLVDDMLEENKELMKD